MQQQIQIPKEIWTLEPYLNTTIKADFLEKKSL